MPAAVTEPLHTPLQVILVALAFGLTIVGCVNVVVKVLEQLLLSVTTNEKVPAHKLEIVVVVIAGIFVYVANIEPEGAERIVIS